MKIGDIVNDHWKVLEDIGGGGQGEVFKVLDTDDSNLYALKFLKKQKDPERRARMHFEVNNVKALCNDHLIIIYDTNCDLYQTIDEKLYYVSTYINGSSLEDYCKSNKVTLDDALMLFQEMLRVISYCHENDIIHRDIKPENILLKDNILSQFVLIDFGLSFNLSDDNIQETYTCSEQQLGNRFLLLPELVAGDKEQKRLKCSDITQACGVFFYVLTGLIPNILLDGENKKPHQRGKAPEILNELIDNPVAYRVVIEIFDKGFNQATNERFNDPNDILTLLQQIYEDNKAEREANIMSAEYEITPSVSDNSFGYTDLIATLNPNPELFNQQGMKLPLETKMEELVNYAVAIPETTRSKIVRYYNDSDFETSVEKVWNKAVTILRKRILSLGEDFVADMIGIDADETDYLQNLPPYTLICLANDLGFIDNAGKRKLLFSNDIFNHYAESEKENYEEMPQDEANVIIKHCISYILCYDSESFGWQMNDFRDKLKSGRITDTYDDIETMFSTSPYFYLKTTVRSLLNLFKEVEDIEFENVVENMNILFPAIWDRLQFEERRALADIYETYYSHNDHAKARVLSRILLKVKGFDYVSENTRSRTFIKVANELKSVHFAMNNFYNEPLHVKTLESLGTKIPKLALKECLTAVIYIKIGNRYGISWDAQKDADKILSRITTEQWTTYLERYLKDETDLVDYIKSYPEIRSRWKEIVKEYDLKSLRIANPTAKSIL